MNENLISGKTITELYRYLQSNGGSYNDLRTCFGNSGIEPSKDVTYRSTRNKDCFLDEYIQPLQLDKNEDSEKLIRFIEQVIPFPPTPKEQPLLHSLRQDGWQVSSNRIIRAGHSVDELLDDMFQGYPIDTIQREWDRAKASVLADPADALTAASSMIEATYKYLLHGLSEPLPDNQSIRGLSKAVYPLLELSPEQTTDEDFRALLQGTITIAQSLGAIRTKIGDAHGASPERGIPAERHARLAINSAGALCVFLLETHYERIKDNSRNVPQEGE